METNRFLEKIRKESQILHPINNLLNDVVIKKDINNLTAHLRRIQGAPGKNGEYYDPTSRESYPGDKKRERGFVPCKLNWLLERQQELNAEFEKYADI